jgi:phage gp29-like protein
MESNPFEGLTKNYIGGLMRPALYLTLLKFYNILDFAKYNELFGMPLRVGYFDPIMSSDKAIAILKTAVQNLGADASAVVDKTTEIKFVDGKVSGKGENYERFANYVESKQSILMLGQTLTTEVSKTGGNRALGQVHDLVRMDKLWSDLQKAQERFTKDVVQKDYFYNYGLPPNGNYPKYEFETDEYKDLSLMATVVRDLSASGKEFDSAWADEFFGTKGPETQTPSFGGNKNPFGGL